MGKACPLVSQALKEKLEKLVEMKWEVVLAAKIEKIIKSGSLNTIGREITSACLKFSGR